MEADHKLVNTPIDFFSLKIDDGDSNSTLMQWLMWSSDEISKLRSNLSLSEEALDFATLALEYAESELKKSRAEAAALAEARLKENEVNERDESGIISPNKDRETLTPTARLHKAILERKKIEGQLADKEREMDEMKSVVASLQEKLVEQERVNAEALQYVAQGLVEEHELEMQNLKKKMSMSHQKEIDKLLMRCKRLEAELKDKEEREYELKKTIERQNLEIQSLLQDASVVKETSV